MKEKRKKRILLGCLLAAVLVVVPIVTYAVVYNSARRNNVFTPGTIDIQVKESDVEGETITNHPTMDASHTALKPVSIIDNRKGEEETLRVCFVPLWLDASGKVCGNVIDLSNGTLTGNDFVYSEGTGAEERTLTLHLDTDWETNGWTYSEEEGYPFFYYRGPLNAGQETPQLLMSVQLNDKAYTDTAPYIFRIDVLADAIQTVAGAAETRSWATEPETTTTAP